MWTEPSPAEELAEAIKKQIDEARPYPEGAFDEYNKQGWDKSEESHKRKLELFESLKRKDLSPSEYANIMKEINSL